MIDERELRKWWAVFKADSPLTEVRILSNNKKTFSGYYTDIDSVIRDVVAYDGNGIYATINAIKPACYSRIQHDTIVANPKETTSDNDIDFRTTILIDLDPNRPSGVNATEEEIKRAREKSREIYRFLNNQGFEKPVVAFSGNGFHLYYRICIQNSSEATTLVKNFLGALSMLFSDEDEGGVKVDTSVFNAARISKIIGTTSNKGANTADRPRRMSQFVYIPPEFKATDVAYVKKVAGMLPQPEKPDKYNNYQPRQFNLDEFISKHGIDVVRKSRYSNGVRYILKECPFDPNHKDAAVFQLDSGALGFSCFHASCQQYHWRDFVLHYDPSAYDKSAMDDFRWRRRFNTPVKQEDIKPSVEDSRGRIWMNAGEFKHFDLRNAQFIPLGIPELDKRILGLILGEVTVVSGGSGSGKTTFVNHIILNAIQRNFRVALWSGEMAGGRIVGWIDQMAAGKNNVEKIEGSHGLYYVKTKEIRDKINNWLGDRFWLYNNNYGQKWSHLSMDIRKCVDEHQINLVVVDNLMALDLDAFDGENNDRQKSFINELTDFASQKNIHIVLVCHPRKENVNQLIRKESIAGSSDITNLAFNVFLLHRTGTDFERRGEAFFGKQKMAELKEKDYSLVLEMVKARTVGYQDLLVGLYYQDETRRLLSDPSDEVVYGWDDTPTPPILPPTLEDMPDFESEKPDAYYNNF